MAIYSGITHWNGDFPSFFLCLPEGSLETHGDLALAQHRGAALLSRSLGLQGDTSPVGRRTRWQLLK